MGIISYFYTDYHINTNLIITLGVLCLLALLFIQSYFHSLKWLKLLLLLVLFFLLGHIVTDFRVENISKTSLDHKIQSRIIAEVDEIEIRGKEKKLLLSDVNFLNFQELKNINKIKIVVRTRLEDIKKKDKVMANVVLMPPPGAVLPGTFDYSRYAFFSGIEAIGYAIGNVKIIKKAEVKNYSKIDRIKQKIFESFYNNMHKNNAAIATALFLGDTKKIDTNIYENIRISGIAHLLAISGMHVGLVGGIIFFISNFIFSKINLQFIKINNKKIASIITIWLCYSYLILANSPISAQRAFAMTTLFLVGILIDRDINPLRTISVAAVVILIFTPEALLSASLQMSFSACFSLIYGFKLIKLRYINFNEHTSILKKVGIYFFSIVLASVFATLATSIFIMFHFKNFSTYSLLTNLLAIPITEFIIMPFGMLAIFLIPVKLEFIGYYPMEKGIEVLLYISNTISSFPSAVINVYNINAHSILCFVVGCLILMLIKTKLKYIAIFCFIALILNIVNFRLPDIVISKNTKLIAVKDLQDNQLYLIRGFRERYSKKVWQKELNIKAVSKKYLREICNQDYCYIPDQKLLILFEEKYNKKFIDICNEIDIKVIVNFTNLYYECGNVILNLNKANFDSDGTHLIYKVKNNYKIITEKRPCCKKTLE